MLIFLSPCNGAIDSEPWPVGLREWSSPLPLVSNGVICFCTLLPISIESMPSRSTNLPRKLLKPSEDPRLIELTDGMIGMLI